MVEIINLRRARKQKQRDDDAKTGATNRIAFGRGKVERKQSAAERALEEKRLDAHKREIVDDP